MYPPPRPAGARASASSATSPRTNPLRSNNERDSMSERRRMQDSPSDSGSGFGEAENYTQDEIKQLRNLNAIIQQFFVKGALTLVSSRVFLTPAKLKDGDDIKYNKWFNLVLPESDTLAEFTAPWRATDVSVERPPPMIIEIYLDLTQLTRSQKLIILDDNGKRWDVADTLNRTLAPGDRPTSKTANASQLVLERWRISLDGSPRDSAMQPGSLSAVYKRGIPLFRSLFTYGRTMPAFKYSRRLLKQPPNHPTVKLNYRILDGAVPSSKVDTLHIPLALSEDDVVEQYSFEHLQCSAGTLNISVTYRTNCDFRVDDTESLMSSHFMASDDHYFRPSLAGRRTEAAVVPSSVPNARHDYSPDSQQEGQVYGSLSTFHRSGAAAPGTSPLSAMRAIRDDATPDTPPLRTQPDHRRSTSSRSSMRAEGASINPRRPSVSFQPFKAGSLASSPGMNLPTSPGTSFPGRPGPASLTHTRNRPSLTTLPQQVLRTPQLPNETAIASSTSSSPKPAPIARYSSSFSHRRSRFSSTGSKGDDDHNSSGKQSASSSAQRGSDEIVNESQRSGSGSMEQSEDDKNLQDFIKLLEAKKDLKSFSRTDSASKDASMRRTTAALSKYRGMRESNTALSDSLSSSLLLQRSSTSSSRQLSSVPPMVHGTSASTSSSPGKPISPHTPHTPAIPSRLSDNLTIDYGDTVRRSRTRRRSPTEAMREENSSEGTARDNTGTNAIDIPTSPHAWPYVRRSSSASGRTRERGLEDEPELYGMRSASLPAEERTELSMSELLRVNMEVQSSSPTGEDSSPQPSNEGYAAYPFPPLDTSQPTSREESSSRPGSIVEPVPQAFRHRLSRGYRRGSPSFSSERGSRYSAGSRLSMQTGEEDDLIFQLSELGSASRRSVEETRGATTSGRGDRRGAWNQ
ncbi:uncharacterized protein PV09_04619 [Verruconis gallopava]|uniref:Autophagy-related protein 13 n=1 Tax=Verruconis gallopava TaxID=253628 RepID=A0A0D2ABV8_9PEZI|nr:uncharacterized protein PV09_04619 [Verruconis gallopava]KIW04328.1 hypothetical protein PV09_04619 [Verruconis gallopava]